MKCEKFDSDGVHECLEYFIRPQDIYPFNFMKKKNIFGCQFFKSSNFFVILCRFFKNIFIAIISVVTLPKKTKKEKLVQQRRYSKDIYKKFKFFKFVFHKL